MHELIERVNWVDLFALILLIRISYVSSFIGVGKQILPLVLLVLTLLLSLYNYNGIAGFFVDKFSLSSSICNFFAFLFIVFILFMLYRLAMRLTGVVAPEEEVPTGNIEKLGGTVLGLLRSVFIIGLVFIGLLLAPIKFTEKSVRNSFLGTFFVKLNLRVYSMTVNAVFRGAGTSVSSMSSELFGKKDRYFFGSGDLKKKSRFFNSKD